jgi:hypothetical protein
MSFIDNIRSRLSSGGVRRAPAIAASPLVLRLGSHELRFQSPREFEYACSGRTTVPSGKYEEMLRLSAEDLEHEVVGIREVEKRIVNVIERSLESPQTAGANIRELGAQLFSKDHGWRGLMSALSGLGPEHDEYKKIALVKYMQYLGARQELANIVFAAKAERAEPAAEGIAEQAQASPTPARQPPPESIPADAIDANHTVMFDVSRLNEATRLLNPFERLPRGETVVVTIPEGGAVEFMMSKYRFRLTAADGIKIVDESGHEYRLVRGRNAVGRHVNNEVNIDNAYRSVSRKHLIAEPYDARSVALTDLSAHGTFVPPQFVTHTVH